VPNEDLDFILFKRRRNRPFLYFKSSSYDAGGIVFVRPYLEETRPSYWSFSPALPLLVSPSYFWKGLL